MKVTGGATLHAPLSAVWAALNNPAVLVRAIPGCERLTATSADPYDLTVTAGVGTNTGTYTGLIALTHIQAPTTLTLRASGSGSPGTVATSVLVSLADDGGGMTELTYDADATIGGLIAGVGQRMLGAAAKRQASQFFAALDELLLAQLEGAGAGPAALPGAVAGMAAGAPQAGTGAAEPGEGRRAAGAAGPPQGGRAGGAAEPAQGWRGAGAAGVSSPTKPATRGASGMTWERSTAAGQPAGLRGASPPNASFLQGAVVGAAIALAGVVVGGLIARRNR